MMEEIEEHRASKHKGASKDPVNQLDDTMQKKAVFGDKEYEGDTVEFEDTDEITGVNREQAIELGEFYDKTLGNGMW